MVFAFDLEYGIKLFMCAYKASREAVFTDKHPVPVRTSNDQRLEQYLDRTFATDCVRESLLKRFPEKWAVVAHCKEK